MSNKLLSVENLTMKFGGLIAIDNLSFSADESQITSIIGPNGAGKSTTIGSEQGKKVTLFDIQVDAIKCF